MILRKIKCSKQNISIFKSKNVSMSTICFFKLLWRDKLNLLFFIFFNILCADTLYLFVLISDFLSFAFFTVVILNFSLKWCIVNILIILFCLFLCHQNKHHKYWQNLLLFSFFHILINKTILSVFISICMLFFAWLLVCQSVCIVVCQSVCVVVSHHVFLSVVFNVNMSVSISICMFFLLLVSLSVNFSFIMSVSLSVLLYGNLFVCLSVL